MGDTSEISKRTYEKMLADWRADEEERARAALEQAAASIQTVTRLAASRGVILGANSFLYVRTIGVVAQAPFLARALLGNVEVSKDGLYRFDDIVRLLPGTLRKGGCFGGAEYIVMAHPCFRRQMHPEANWAPRFIELLWAFNEPGIDKFVAIDADRVRIDVSGPDYFEFDTWFGAPFNEDVSRIRPGIVKLRPPMDVDEMIVNLFFAKCHCLDIRWSDQGGIKTFQALELKTEDVQLELEGNSYFPARYLHAEFDVDSGAFRHFDGAVQYLLRDEYERRRDGDFNLPAKDQRHIKARSQKVFKLNGPLPTERWVELSCQFLAGNPLTFEYFTGSYPNHVKEAITNIRSRSERTTDVHSSE